MNFETHRFYSPKDAITTNGGPLPISLSSVYKAIRQGEIPVKRIGKRMLIPGTYLIELLNSNGAA